MTSRAARYAATLAVIDHAHHAADYIVQTDSDAQAKGKPGREGRAACARHVATHTLTLAAGLYAANRYLGLGLKPSRVAAALAVSAATHYGADRSAGHWKDTEPTTLLVRAAHALGKQGWVQNDPTAGPLLDQAVHTTIHGLAAAIASH